MNETSHFIAGGPLVFSSLFVIFTHDETTWKERTERRLCYSLISSYCVAFYRQKILRRLSAPIISIFISRVKNFTTEFHYQTPFKPNHKFFLDCCLKLTLNTLKLKCNLHTFLFTFPKVLIRRISFTMKSFWLVITSLILMTLMCDSGVMLWGDIRCQSPIGVKGLQQTIDERERIYLVIFSFIE